MGINATVKLDTNEGPIEATAFVIVNGWGEPTFVIVDAHERPSSWRRQAAEDAVRGAILDGRIRVDGVARTAGVAS